MSDKSNKEYLRQARQLNKHFKLGIKHENGKGLTPQLKAKITREYKKHAEYIKQPDAFKKIRIKGARLEQLKKNGYHTTKTLVYVPKYDANDVVIRKNTILHVNADRYTETLIGDTAEILQNFKSVFDNKKKGQFVAASFGGAGLFKLTTFDSYERFMNYLSNFAPQDAKDATPKQQRESKEKLIAQLRLVTVPKSWRTKLKTGNKKAVKLSKALERFNK